MSLWRNRWENMKLGQNQSVLLKQCVAKLNVSYDQWTLKVRTFGMKKQSFGQITWAMFKVVETNVVIS